MKSQGLVRSLLFPLLGILTGTLLALVLVEGAFKIMDVRKRIAKHQLTSRITRISDIPGVRYEMVPGISTVTPSHDAIVTTNSLLTAGAFMAIRERGLSIPSDIGLVGFDETTWGALVEPAITIIAQPTYEIGSTAAELLLQRIEQPDRPPRKVILQGRLVVRGSSLSR